MANRHSRKEKKTEHSADASSIEPQTPQQMLVFVAYPSLLSVSATNRIVVHYDVSQIVQTRSTIAPMSPHLEDINRVVRRRPLKRERPLAALLSFSSRHRFSPTLLVAVAVLRTERLHHPLQRRQNVHLDVETVVRILPLRRRQRGRLRGRLRHCFARRTLRFCVVKVEKSPKSGQIVLRHRYSRILSLNTTLSNV